MKQVARLGDRHVCPIHGVNAITATASASTADGCAIATVGDMAAWSRISDIARSILLRQA